MKQIVADGHEIGNHSWSHSDLTTLSDRDISWEITRADAAIQPFYGRSTHPLFRAPFGARNKRVLKVVDALEYRSIYWSTRQCSIRAASARRVRTVYYRTDRHHPT